ncbi:site-2 protease family protein [Mycolicibacterium austroafricanum]|uniref:site-2 protease family protein n=1 Tax=Mycolicibacterium austroafricanum TaxID=39687 RepID=UPI001CA36435|nr:site-2 protease family protein [Mycolicibacterium austroafricanum]QZT63420.1 site-2 protease family protein [Mycolicibacterium austroafricanum]
MEHGVVLGRVRGLTVSVHWSVVVIVWLFAWSLASTLPGSAPGYPDAVYWVAGFCGAVLFAAGLLAHELAHAVVARRSGIPVPEVTLWLFGGVARLAGEAKTPRDEFRMAAAGPALSLALSAVFAAVAAGLAGSGISPLATEVAAWLAAANAVLAVFNLLPGAPLDGGRILRAYLWHRHGDPVRAAIGAARAGCVVAYLLIGLGLLEFLLGSLIGGAWLAFIGWFLLTAARDEDAAVRARTSLAGVRVVDVMTPNPRTVPESLSVQGFIDDHLLGDRHSAYPVTSGDGTCTGLVTLSQVRAVPPGERVGTRLADVVIPRGRMATAEPAEPLVAVLERLDRSTGNRIVVMAGDRVVGVVTAADVARMIDVRSLAAAGQPAGPGNG